MALKVVLFIGALLFIINQVLLTSAACTAPNNLYGECQNIRNCNVMVEVMRLQSKEAIKILRNSQCGYDGDDPKVCCPVDNRQQPESLDTIISRNPFRRPPKPSPPRTYDFLLPPECGFSNATHKRVVGGNDAVLGAWPWITALGYKHKQGLRWLCGGSLISSRHVLTAAHCIYQRNDLVVVRIGDLKLNDEAYDGANPLTVEIEKATVHPRYNPLLHINDIGVIKMAWDIQFSELIRPICLPVTREIEGIDLLKRRPFIAGWGSTSFTGPSSDTLQEVQIPVVDEASCRNAFSNLGVVVIDERVLCAGYAAGGKDACQGDSGGPMMQPINKIYYEIGLVSYGYKCAERGFPGVYTRVDKYLDFIAANLV